MGHVPQPYEVTIVSILFMVLCSASVALRFYSRKLKAMKLGVDDWVTLASWVFVMGLCGLLLYNSFRGHLDKTLKEMTVAQRTGYLQRLFSEVILSHTSMALTKISIVLFYLRIFTLRKFKPWAYAAIGLTLAWMIGSVLALVFSRSPVAEFWRARRPAIYNYPAAQVGFNAVDIAIDIYILCLPLPLISKLKIKRGRKLALIAVFWLGAFCVAAAAVRMYYSVELVLAPPMIFMPPDQFKVIIVNTTLWGTIEPACSLIAACLPTFSPLVREEWGIHTIYQGVVTLLSRTATSVGSLLSPNRSQRSGRTEDQNSDPTHDRDWYQLKARDDRSESESSAKLGNNHVLVSHTVELQNSPRQSV